MSSVVLGRAVEGPEASRVAEVIVATREGTQIRGSGYRITWKAVLTAAHVVRDAMEITVRFNADQANEWVTLATCIHIARTADLAVVTLSAMEDDSKLKPALFGRVGDRAAVIECVAIGFPRFKLKSSGPYRGHGNASGLRRYRDRVQAVGRIPVLSNSREGTLEIITDPPESDPDPSHSPWEGMSGAAVWCSGRIVAVVSKHHRTDSPARFAAARIDRWVDALSPGEWNAVGESLALSSSNLSLPDVVPLVADHVLPTGYSDQPISRPAQLPADVVDFTGRRQELASLDLQIAARRRSGIAISVITGTAGVGKTGLAVHWAHRVAQRFPDGQLYIDLRGFSPGVPIDPLDALTQSLRALNVSADKIPLELGQAAKMYRSLLDGRAVLVVLDNAFNVHQVRPLLPPNPTSYVIVTSRNRLGGLVAREGARPLLLRPMLLEESLELLSVILEPDRVAAEYRESVRLANLCQQLPLALRIAAANLLFRPQQTIASYVVDLSAGNQIEGLMVHGDETAAVGAAFDLSYQRLDAEQRLLFRLLGLVPGADFTAYLASALLDTSPRRADHLLECLATAHLIQGITVTPAHDAGNPPSHPASDLRTSRAAAASGSPYKTESRFQFHDLLRAYASQQCQNSETLEQRELALLRILRWYLCSIDFAAKTVEPRRHRIPHPDAEELFSRADLSRMDPMEWLESERANIVATVREASNSGADAFAWQIADAVFGFLELRKYTKDNIEVQTTGLRSAIRLGDLRTQAGLHNNLAIIYRRSGQYDSAMEHHQSALALYRRQGDALGEAEVLDNLGGVYRRLSQYRPAIEHHQSALALYRRQGDALGEAWALDNLGAAYRRLSLHREAIEHHQNALSLHSQIKNQIGESRALDNLGVVFRRLGRLTEAQDSYNRAIRVRHEIGDRCGEARTLDKLGAHYRKVAKYDMSIDHHQRALVIHRELRDRDAEGWTLNNLGAVYRCVDQVGTALTCHEEALQIHRSIRDKCGEGRTLDNIGMALRYMEKYNKALEFHQLAYSIYEDIEDRYGAGRALDNLGVAYRCLGNYEEARPSHQRALDIQTEIGDLYGQGRALDNLGVVFLRLEVYPEALEFFKRSLVVREHVRDRCGIGHTLGNIGSLYFWTANEPLALDYLQRALGILEEIGDRSGMVRVLDDIGAVSLALDRTGAAREYHAKATEIRDGLRNRIKY